MIRESAVDTDLRGSRGQLGNDIFPRLEPLLWTCRRAAEVGYGVSVIEAVAVLGNMDITIPPEIAVECDGDSLLGSFVLK